MAIDANTIRKLIEDYRLQSSLDPRRNVILAAERSDLVDGSKLELWLRTLDARLIMLGVGERSRMSVKNIVLELAGNVALHGSGGRNETELLIVSQYDGAIRMWMFGYGRPSQIHRLHRIVKYIYTLAKPPLHREILLKRRNEELIRTSQLPDSVEFGGGAGMLTIAALSREPISIYHNPANEKSFALYSVV